MKRAQIKSKEKQCIVIQYSSNANQNMEDSEDLFCKPYYQQPVDTNLTESKDILPIDSDSVQSRNEKVKAMWLDKHCRLLIALYKEEYPNVGKTIEMKTKTKLWQRIAKRMEEQGSYFTPSQVQGKWNTFERAFNRNINKNKALGPYAKDLSEFFLKHSSPSPTSFLEMESTTGSESTKQKTSIDARVSPPKAAFPMMSFRSVSPPVDDDISLESFTESPKRQKKSETVLDEFKKWREEFAQERKAKMEYRFAKLNEYKKRTILLEQQLRQKQQLLMTFMESQNKIL